MSNTHGDFYDSVVDETIIVDDQAGEEQVSAWDDTASTSDERPQYCNLDRTACLLSPIARQKRKYSMKNRQKASVFKCRFCKLTVKYPSKIVEHLRTHTGERPYKCVKCEASFTQTGALTAHIRVHYGERPFACQYCDRRFTTSGQRTVHERMCNEFMMNDGNNNKKCINRTLIVSSTGRLLQSYSDHDPSAKYFFEEMVDYQGCNQQSNYTELTISSQHHNNRGFVNSADRASYTNKDVGTESNLAEEMLLVTPKKMRNKLLNADDDNCEDIMPRYIVEDDDVINHDELDEDAYEYVASADPPSKGRKRINADDKQEKVLVTSELFKFARPQTLRRKFKVNPTDLRHLYYDNKEELLPENINSDSNESGKNSSQGQGPNELQAIKLDKVIDSSARAHDHINNEISNDQSNQNAPSSSQKQGSTPTSKRFATIHRCEYCGKLLKYPSKIEAHLRTHTNEKPFKCSICSMGFAQKTTLRMHLRRHLNHKPFVCPYDGCEYRFINGGLLNAHIQKVHLQMRRFSCLLGCSRTFKTDKARQAHEKNECRPNRHYLYVVDTTNQEYNKCGKNSSKDYSKMSDKHEEPLEVVEDGPCINHVDAITHNNFAAPSSSSVVEMEDYYFEDFQ